jgi:hypothetical protein
MVPNFVVQWGPSGDPNLANVYNPTICDVPGGVQLARDRHTPAFYRRIKNEMFICAAHLGTNFGGIRLCFLGRTNTIGRSSFLLVKLRILLSIDASRNGKIGSGFTATRLPFENLYPLVVFPQLASGARLWLAQTLGAQSHSPPRVFRTRAPRPITQPSFATRPQREQGPSSLVCRKLTNSWACCGKLTNDWAFEARAS